MLGLGTKGHPVIKIRKTDYVAAYQREPCPLFFIARLSSCTVRQNSEFRDRQNAYSRTRLNPFLSKSLQSATDRTSIKHQFTQGGQLPKHGLATTI